MCDASIELGSPATQTCSPQVRSGGHLLGLTVEAAVWHGFGRAAGVWLPVAGQPAHGRQCVACGLRHVCCLQLAATLQAQLQQLQQAMLSDSAAEAALQQQLSASQAAGLQAQRELQAAHQQVQELREGQAQLQGECRRCSGKIACMVDGKVDMGRTACVYWQTFLLGKEPRAAPAPVWCCEHTKCSLHRYTI